MSRAIGNGKMGRVKVDVDLANYSDVVLARAGHLEPEKVRRARVTGVVDTGATYLVLPKATANQLGLPTTGKTAAALTREPERIASPSDLRLPTFGV